VIESNRRRTLGVTRPTESKYGVPRAVSTGQRNIMVTFQGDTWGESGWGDDKETTHDG
jgi:hypothetical protein